MPLPEAEGVGMLIWSPLAGGFLSGKKARGADAPDGSRWSTNPFPPVEEDRVYDTLDVLRPIAEAHGATVAQTALAWLLHQKVVSTVLVGAKRMDQLEDNLGATKIAFTPEQLAAIDEVSRLRAEYPGWMFEFWSSIRGNMLANSKR